MISFFFIFLPLFFSEKSPIGLVNRIGGFSRQKAPLKRRFSYSV